MIDEDKGSRLEQAQDKLAQLDGHIEDLEGLRDNAFKLLDEY